MTETMQAAVFRRYGPPEVVQVERIARPKPKTGELCIKVHASALNSGDWRVRKADPYLVRLYFGLFKPRLPILGTSFSGTVFSLGKKVDKWQVGDEVFGLSEKHMGTHAEYFCIDAGAAIAIKPDNLSHAEAASIPFGAHTALHFLRGFSPTQRPELLIYGASGAVGTAAVQIGRHLGFRVTAVCSGKNIELVRQLGAAEVIDYTSDSFSTFNDRFDLIFETVNQARAEDLAIMAKTNADIILGAAMPGASLAIKRAGKALGKRLKKHSGIASVNAADIWQLANWAADESLVPVIDRSFTLAEIAAAHGYVEAGHKRGNVVIDLDTSQ
jgi:NADPH:quinone reductase-like Zn-dependent oxidoreductase